jgi:hypothetical protein
VNEVIWDLIFSRAAFGAGRYMVYQILQHQLRWDDFWDQQNRRCFWATKGWAGAAVSKCLSYLIAVILLVGGLNGVVSSLLMLLTLITLS